MLLCLNSSITSSMFYEPPDKYNSAIKGSTQAALSRLADSQLRLFCVSLFSLKRRPYKGVC